MVTKQTIFSASYQQPMVALKDLLDDYDDGKGNKTPKYFRIPIYQRGYAWGIRQCYELWEDIKRVKENKVNSHFIGTLSLNLNSCYDGDSAIQNSIIYDIVDGQQRFTTLMIILRLLLCKVNSPYVADYIGESKFKRKFQYTYSNREAREYLEGRLYSLDENFPHNDNAYSVNIENAIKFFDEHQEYDRKFNLFEHKPQFPKWYDGCDIGKMPIQDAQEYLDIILTKLIFSVNFVGINYNVNTVFESMNNRGKDPTRLEVLKNRLMYLTPQQYIKDGINQTWGKIYASLGSRSYAVLSDDEFLKCHWYMFHGKIEKRNKDIHIDQIFDDVFSLDKMNDPNTQQLIEDYISSLDKSISIWRYLNIPESVQGVSRNLTSGNAAKIIGKLSRLIGVNSQAFLKSFILAVLCADNLSLNILEQLLDIIEKYIFIIGYLKRDKNAFSSSWATLAHDIYELNIKADISGLKAKVTEIIADKEKEIRTNLTDALDVFYRVKNDKYGYYGWTGRWYFLFEYDFAMPGKQQVGANTLAWYDWKTIEHILPESPYKSAYWTKAFDLYINDPDAMHIFMHSLGNFLPLDGKNNSSLGNADYYTKCNGNGEPKKFYYKNGCALARDIVQTYGDRYWTPTQIYKRIDAMAAFLFDTWIKPYATGNITAQDISDNLKIANLNPPVLAKIDSTIQQALDQEIVNIQAAQQAKVANQQPTGQNSSAATQSATAVWKRASLYQPLESIFNPLGFKIAFSNDAQYLRIYKPQWHKNGNEVHYQIWSQNLFALVCEKKTSATVIQKLSADCDVVKILDDYYDNLGKQIHNRWDLKQRFADNAAIIKAIEGIINATWAKVDACL